MLDARACACFSLLALCLGGACTASVEPIRYGPKCPDLPAQSDSPAPPGTDLLISDFEDGSAQLATVGGRSGVWSLGQDYTRSDKATVAISPGCSVQGYRAGHFEDLGFGGWGANWTAYFVPQPAADASPTPPPVTYDASAYSGISLWAAFGGDNPAFFAVRIGIVTIDTAWNSPVCNPCSDHYFVKPTLTGQWTRYDLLFDDMKQGGVGNPKVAMKRDQMVGLMIWPAQGFDLWIDDVRFLP